MENVQTVGLASHPKQAKPDIAYGTAGFRTKGELLDHVMYRMGALAVLRSKLKESSIGVMITASHNPECDNGVKLVDPMGEMLQQSWEAVATKLANAEDNKLAEVLNEIIAEHQIPTGNNATVVVGRDTRQSSPTLSQAVIDGVEAAGGKVEDFGILSTPQLHYLVVCKNTKGQYGQPTETGYFDKISKAFAQFRGQKASNGNYQPSIKFDGANGVGAAKMKLMADAINGSEKLLEVEVFNDGLNEGDVLNFGCGADFVKVQQKCPRNLEDSKPLERCVAVDGDADRVVYFFKNEAGVFQLMDGDKIATLIAGYFKELLTESGLDLSLGLVQTAYANGSSTKYITEKLNVPVACVPTGVKHLHHKAQDYDIGVYFEANGHGTVTFSDKAHSKIRENASNNPDPKSAGSKLEQLMNVINETVGDAISDMLLVESILHVKGWSVQDWSKAYTDLPNRLMKVTVADRTVFRTTDAERRCVSPAGLQDAVDQLVTRGGPSHRSFVRPSGTEDAVRVYAEADTRENADALAIDVCRAVFDMAGGVGNRP